MALSVTAQLIIEAAKKRGWKVEVINEDMPLYRLHLPNNKVEYVRNITSRKSTSVIGVITKQKDVFYEIAKTLQVIQPATLTIEKDKVAAQEFLTKYKKVVVKPIDQSHGNGVTVNIVNNQELEQAIERARSLSKRILLQQQIDGDDYRLLYIGGRLAAAAIRRPAFVVGDGQHTIEQLIAKENLSPLRGEGYQNIMTKINTEAALEYLGNRLREIPSPGVEVQVVGTANIGKGGVSIDVTDKIPPALLKDASSMVKDLNIGLAGLDFIVDSQGVPYLIEVNVSPSLGLHEFPYEGKKRDTPEVFLDWLLEP